MGKKGVLKYTLFSTEVQMKLLKLLYVNTIIEK